MNEGLRLLEMGIFRDGVSFVLNIWVYVEAENVATKEVERSFFAAKDSTHTYIRVKG